MRPATTSPASDQLDTWSEWVHSSPLQAWIKDLRSRFVAVSPRLARWCGVETADMAGHNEDAFFPEERVRQFRLDDLRVVSLNRPVVVEEAGPRGRFATFKQPLRDRRGRVCATAGIAFEWPVGSGEPPIALPPPHKHPPPWLHLALEQVEQNFRHPLCVRQLAVSAGRHPNHVSRAFRHYVGVSATEWLHRLRVAWVAETLLTGPCALVTLAHRGGFSDQAHMTRLFKRYYGITPGQYRHALRADRHGRNAADRGHCGI